VEGKTTGVRAYLLRAPTWVLSVIQGTVFGTLMGIFYSFHKPLRGAAISGLVAGALFGAVMGPVTATRRRKALDAVGVTPELSLQARLVAFRGPIPTDEGVR
jgi:membrane associated rhomboid family serine protease